MGSKRAAMRFVKSLVAAVSSAGGKSSGRLTTRSGSSSAVEACSSSTLSAQLLSSLDRTGPKTPHDPSLSLPSANHSPEEISSNISSILIHESENEDQSPNFSNPKEPDELISSLLGMKFTSNNPQTQNPTQWRKDLSRERKRNYIFRHTESTRFTKLVKMCAAKIGPDSTIGLFSQLGRGTGLKDYNAFIKQHINIAKSTKDEDLSLQNIHNAYLILKDMSKKGFLIEEDTYGYFLNYLVDFKMIREFDFISDFIKTNNPRAFLRIAYYEMVLCIRVSDDDRIYELCKSVEAADDADVSFSLAESYLLAFCESDRKKEVSQLLESLDTINKVSKAKYVTSIFKCLGRVELENFAEKFLSQINKSGDNGENFTRLVYEYVTSLPNLSAREMVIKFTSLHEKFEVIPPFTYYEKFISYFCDLYKINEALDIIEHMSELGFDVSSELFNQIIHACDKSFEIHMVHDIYSTMQKINFKPDGEIFKSLISLCVKMRDFEGAYNILEAAKETGETLTTSMYNSIMAGYFREKNSFNVQMVFKQMKNDGVKPDGDTFSYLLALSNSQNDISKYWDELQKEGVQITKSIFTGLIHAYSKLGNFDLVKQVVNHPDIPVKYLLEIKSTMVSSLASNGKILDALQIYDEIKKSGSNLDPKATMSLIEHMKMEGEIEKMKMFLNELEESNYWYDGCCRVILYCVQHDYIHDAIALLKQIKERDETTALMGVDQIFSHVRSMEPVKLESGLKLLNAIKEELGLQISRTSLDFLLSMCVKAKDSQTARIIWKEYESAGLPYNILTLLRMYQALLAAGEVKIANEILKNIPNEDYEVRSLIKCCKLTYLTRNHKKNIKKKNK